MKYFLLSFLLLSLATAADREGNPGETKKLKFMAMANKIYLILKKNPSDFPEVKAEEFLEKIGTMQVLFIREELPKVGETHPVAMNFPEENLIKVNFLRWAVGTHSYQDRLSLVFHEILGLMKKNDGNHLISSRILNFIDGEDVAQVQQYTCQAHCLIHSPKAPDYYGHKSFDHISVQSEQMMGVGLTMAEAFLELQDSCQWLQQSLPWKETLVHLVQPNPHYCQDWTTPQKEFQMVQVILADINNSCIKDGAR